VQPRFRALPTLATLMSVTVALKKRSNAELLEEVARLPERMTGEVIDGELHVMGRPTPGHQNVGGEVTGAVPRRGLRAVPLVAALTAAVLI